MMPKKIPAILMAALMVALLAPSLAFAVNVSLSLSRNTANPGDSVTALGTADADTWVTIKVLDSAQNIIVFDGVKSDANGSYSCTFILPGTSEGTLTVVAGYESNVDNKTITVGATAEEEEPTEPTPGFSGGGGSTTTSQAVNSTTGSATVAPGYGGTISLGSDVSLKIPAGALKGAANVNVTIKAVSSPPAIPAGLSLQGSVFELTVDGNASYSFNKPVTLTFTFDPDSLTAEETPTVYYYDETSARWVSLGGDISGHSITVTVDHFTKFAVLAKEATPSTVQPAPVAGQLFSDVPASYWAQAVINKLSTLGYINGYPDGSFKPENSISRAEFATVLVKAFNLPLASGKVFDDTANHWAKDHIAGAYAAGIVSGYSESSFGPDDPITREQMAAMIVKAAKIEAATEKVAFTDSGEVSDWAKDALAAVVQNKIMQGYPDGAFAPRNKATRAEAVTVIANALE